MPSSIHADTRLEQIPHFMNCLVTDGDFIGHSRQRKVENVQRRYSEMTVSQLLAVLGKIRVIHCKKQHEKNKTNPEDCPYRGHAACGHQELPDSSMEQLQVGALLMGFLGAPAVRQQEIREIFQQHRVSVVEFDLSAGGKFDTLRPDTIKNEIGGPENTGRRTALTVIYKEIDAIDDEVAEPLLQLQNEIVSRIRQSII